MRFCSFINGFRSRSRFFVTSDDALVDAIFDPPISEINFLKALQGVAEAHISDPGSPTAIIETLFLVWRDSASFQRYMVRKSSMVHIRVFTHGGIFPGLTQSFFFQPHRFQMAVQSRRQEPGIGSRIHFFHRFCTITKFKKRITF